MTGMGLLSNNIFQCRSLASISFLEIFPLEDPFLVSVDGEVKDFRFTAIWGAESLFPRVGFFATEDSTGLARPVASNRFVTAEKRRKWPRFG